MLVSLVRLALLTKSEPTLISLTGVDLFALPYDKIVLNSVIGAGHGGQE